MIHRKRPNLIPVCDAVIVEDILGVNTTNKDANTILPIIAAVHLYQEIDFREYQNRSAYKERLLPWANNFFKENPNVAMIFLSSNRELYLPLAIEDEKNTVRYMRQGFVMESPQWDHSEVEELGI